MGHRVVNSQVRVRQPFAGANRDFRSLLECAGAAIRENPSAYALGQQRLLICVASASPAHTSMRKLCDLARSHPDFEQFESSLSKLQGPIARRWHHVLEASGNPADTCHEILASLQIVAFDLETEASRDRTEMVNRLAGGWDIPHHEKGRILGAELTVFMAEAGLSAALVDLGSMEHRLSAHLPPNLGHWTRRARLAALRDATQSRVRFSLQFLGIELAIAEALASRALAAPPRVDATSSITVISGDLGVGKTTELERLHRAAIDSAMESSNAPIPIKLHARAAEGPDFLQVVQDATRGLGDPTRVGVHLCLDGADETAALLQDLVQAAASVVAMWPASKVVLATRPQSAPRGAVICQMPPLSVDEATELMLAINPTEGGPKWLRDDLTEVLRRPLFAVRYALNRRAGDYTATSEAGLVRDVAQEALSTIKSLPVAFELLARLACAAIDHGGLVPLATLDLRFREIATLSQSRILDVGDGTARFQLAVLAEWFSGEELLHDPAIRKRVLGRATTAHRWRHAIVQALLQASPSQVDDLMQDLVTSVPSTAAWAFRRAVPHHSTQRLQAPAEDLREAGQRIRLAMNAWLSVWPPVSQELAPHGVLPPVGVSLDGTDLSTFWYAPTSEPTSDNVIEIATEELSAHPPPGRIWLSQHGTPPAGELWPWDQTFKILQAKVKTLFKSLALAGGSPACWHEMAWVYGRMILGNVAGAAGQAVSVSDLKDVITSHRQRSPYQQVTIRSPRGEWDLAEAEHFLAVLAEKGISSLKNPWPAGDRVGGWIWNRWTPEQLLRRLNMTTKAALDTYKFVVDQKLPHLAGELSTYRILPAEVCGTLEPGNGSEDRADQPRFTWHLEPLPKTEPNGAFWKLGQMGGDAPPTSERAVAARRRQVQTLRDEAVELIKITTHYGEADVYSDTPAADLALRLLHNDLADFGWTSGANPFRRTYTCPTRVSP